MTQTRWAYCLDCEWTGEALGTNPRRCPSCGGPRVVLKSNNELVRAIAARPQDDADREQVIGDIRRAVDMVDYALLTGLAGDLSGAELN